MTFVTSYLQHQPDPRTSARVHNRYMVRRVPQRETEGTIAWVLRFIEANKHLLRSRKRSRRTPFRKDFDRKTA